MMNMKEPTRPASSTSPNTKRAPVPGWLILSVVLGTPLVIITVGLMMDRHIMELVMFSLLCLFGLALVFFMR